MSSRDRFLPILLLASVLAAPAAGPWVAAASADGEDQKQKVIKPQPTLPNIPDVQNDQEPKTKAETRNKTEDNPYSERFKQLDRNQDGSVTLDEWSLDPQSFATVDRDKNGRLSRTELLTPNVIHDRRQELFLDLDTDRDGRLSRFEWQRSGLIGIDRLDRNKDGTITRSEFHSQVEIIQNTWKPGTRPMTQNRFRLIDRNLDNRVSRLEWPGVRALFDRLDRNHDGFLSPNEWPGP